jgi:hypothetical protein
MTRHTHTPRQQRAISIAAILVICGVAAVVALGTLPGGAAAQTNNTTNTTATPPGYYENASTTTPSGWLEDRQDPTLVNVSALATRVGTFVIGSGSTTQGGGGPAGVVVFGLVVVGSVLGVVRGASVGSVAGPILLIAAAAVIVSVGLAPLWLYAVILLGVGVVGAAAILRAL